MAELPSVAVKFDPGKIRIKLGGDECYIEPYLIEKFVLKNSLPSQRNVIKFDI